MWRKIVPAVVVRGLLHEEVGRSAMRVVRILVRRRSDIFWRVHEILWCRIRVEISVNRMTWQIAMSVVTALVGRAAVAVWSMNGLSARSGSGLAHWASVRHHGAGGPWFLRTLPSHDRCC